MKCAIHARNLRKAYGDFEAVRSIDFDIQPGECFGFLGPNGAGKTTTMSMLYGAARPTSGDLRIMDFSVDQDMRAIKRRMGVVTQYDSLDRELTVEQNLRVFARYYGIPRREVPARIEALLVLLQLSEKRHKRIEELSGGMRRRLLIGRALIHEPQVLILDEPTTGLDPQARQLVWHRLHQLRSNGMTMVLTTHYMDEAESLCDRLVIMDHGRILARGTPRALISEYAGREVIEFPAVGKQLPELLQLLTGLGARFEQFLDNVYIFFPREGEAQPLLPRLAAFRFVHRMATLEDVFLMLTGRELNE